ncbi:cation:proton antiporter [Edaphobacter aggregans]|uniref:cation:proton antiporter domain-containing protein n=1 Tax=Edaphobacter aggregans TaxID=570835 RepID=UPI000552B827|nr:cation:proton antiporter [Edaphobacter aggregans]
MDLLTTISVVSAITAVLSWISLRWLKTTTIGVPALTAFAAVALVSGGNRLSGIRQWCANLTAVFDPSRLFFYVVVPLLLFTASSCFGFNPLGRKHIASSGTAIFRGLLTAFGVAGVISSISRGAIDWSECMLFGSLVSATDSVGQARLLAHSSASGNLRRQLIRESIINSVFAASLFIAILQLTQSESSAAWKSTLLLLIQAVGGVMLGLAAGWAGARAIDGLEDRATTVLVVGALLCIAFLTSQNFGLAGPLEAVASGLAFRLSSCDRQREDVEETPSPDFWNAIADIENSVLFVMLGLWIAANGMNATAITAGLAGLLATLLVRFASTRIAILHFSKRGFWERRSALLHVLGGCRGGIPIALALAVPYPATRSWILGATFIVTVFSTVVQAGTIGWISPFGGRKAGQSDLAAN